MVSPDFRSPVIVYGDWRFGSRIENIANGIFLAEIDFPEGVIVRHIAIWIDICGDHICNFIIGWFSNFFIGHEIFSSYVIY